MGEQINWPMVSAGVAVIGLTIGLATGWKVRSAAEAAWKQRVDDHLSRATPLLEEVILLSRTVAVNQTQISTLTDNISRLTDNVQALLMHEGRQ